jgi:hypothetical protein
MNTQDGYDWPNGCSDERWPRQSLLAAQREREIRARCLDALTERVLSSRRTHPDAARHTVCSRAPGRVVQHVVPSAVPALSVRAWLARDLGWAN